MKDPYLTWFMGWVSYLGKGWIQAIPCLILIGTGLLLKRGERMKEAGGKGIYAIITAGVLSQAIKHLIGRPRPKVADVAGLAFGPSLSGGFDAFPSGHAASSFALASALSVFYPGIKYPLYLYSVLVSLSRVYLSAHFMSDVFAGALLGLWIGRVIGTWSMEDIKRMVRGPGIVLGIAALSFFLSFHRLGDTGLFDVDEAVYAESAREMVETGDWITPQYNYANRYDKPALFYWLISSAYGLFGVNEFAARFWSAVFGVLLIMASYYFIRHIAGNRWGILGALMLATSLEVIILSHAAITDMTLTLFISLSLICFFLGYTGEERYKRWWYRGSYFGIALAVLTKGPVGMVIPGMIILLFILLRGRIRERLREMEILSGLAIFLLIALPWYAAETWINGWEYIDAFFIKHNITRYTGVISGHSGPVYYFIPVILLMFFPWSAYLPYSIVRSFYTMRPGGRSGGRRSSELNRRELLSLFSLLWFLVIFVFFSLSRTKLPGYIAPLSPAVAILVGGVWDEYLVSPSQGVRWMRFSTGLCAILGIFMAIGLAATPVLLRNSEQIHLLLQESLEGLEDLYIIAAGMITGIILFVLMIWRQRKWTAFGALTAMMVFTAYVLLTQIAPLADRYLQSSIRGFARMAGTQSRANESDLVVYGLNKPSIVFYARRPVEILRSKEKDSLSEVMTSSKRLYIITRDSKVDLLLNYPEVSLVGQKGGYALLTNQPSQQIVEKGNGN